MGNNGSIGCEFTEFKNVCEMGDCVTSTKGLPINSASDTDTWIQTFANGTTYDDLPLKSAFLKIWLGSLARESLKPITGPVTGRYGPNGEDHKIGLIRNDTLIYNDNKNKLGALDYESVVYKEIVKPLVERNICGNFVKYLGSGRDCSFDDTVKMCKVDDPEIALLYNSQKLISKGIGGAGVRRLAIDKVDEAIKRGYSTEPGISLEWVKENVTFNILVNENAKPDTLTLNEWEKKHRGSIYNSSSEMKNEYICIIFQCIAACYAMSCSKLTHHDIHMNNVFVEPLSQKTRLSYIYDGQLYTFETKYFVKIYDFDRAYANSLGDNILLKPDKGYCNIYRTCNEYIDNYDVTSIFKGVIAMALDYDKDKKVAITAKEDFLKKGFATANIWEPSRIVDSLIRCLTPDATIKTTTYISSAMFDGRLTRRVPYAHLDNQSVGTEFYDKILTCGEILVKFSKSAMFADVIETSYPPGYSVDEALKNTFFCDRKMFNKHGKIDTNYSEGPSCRESILVLTDENRKLKEENKMLLKKLQDKPVTGRIGEVSTLWETSIKTGRIGKMGASAFDVYPGDKKQPQVQEPVVARRPKDGLWPAIAPSTGNPCKKCLSQRRNVFCHLHNKK